MSGRRMSERERSTHSLVGCVVMDAAHIAAAAVVAAAPFHLGRTRACAHRRRAVGIYFMARRERAMSLFSLYPSRRPFVPHNFSPQYIVVVQTRTHYLSSSPPLSLCLARFCVARAHTTSLCTLLPPRRISLSLQRTAASSSSSSRRRPPPM